MKRFTEESDLLAQRKEAAPDIRKEIEDEVIMCNQEDDDAHSNLFPGTMDNPPNVAAEMNDEQEPRRSSRRPVPNRRYLTEILNKQYGEMGLKCKKLCLCYVIL